jgi:hypothetical protein
VIVGCGATKRELAEDEEIAACALYTGDLFRKSLAFARTLAPDTRIWIASAFHGLVALDAPVYTYNWRLPTAKAERERWGGRVVADLRQLVTSDAAVELIILAGKEYAEPIRNAAPRHWTIDEPLGRRFIGSRRAWLAEQLAPLDAAGWLGLTARQRLAELRALRRVE